MGSVQLTETGGRPSSSDLPLLPVAGDFWEPLTLFGRFISGLLISEKRLEISPFNSFASLAHLSSVTVERRLRSLLRV